MMSKAHSARPPTSSASTDPPMTPGAVPRNSRVMLTARPASSSPMGVAEDTPSRWKVDIVLPKEISRKQRAASAGFTKFLPSPPKQHLTTSMANTEPMKGMYTGTSGERESASIRPVTIALPSSQVSGLWQSLSNANSVATADATATTTTMRAFRPLTTMPTTAVGSIDSSTTRMMNAVVHLSRVWGPEEIFNAVFIFYLLPRRACAP